MIFIGILMVSKIIEKETKQDTEKINWSYWWDEKQLIFSFQQVEKKKTFYFNYNSFILFLDSILKKICLLF